MAACDSLQHIFEKPLPDHQKATSILESLSSPWKPADQKSSSSFFEMFGEHHFKETTSPSSSLSFPISLSSSSSSSSSSKSFLDTFNINNSANSNTGQYKSRHTKSDSFSSMNSESLQLCTEGLGFESSDDVEDLRSEISTPCEINWQEMKANNIAKHSAIQEENVFRRSRSCGGGFPPPISCIGKSGKPWVCFKSYRHDGRFVLKEIRMPSQEFLHACREDGRLKLQFIQPNDDILEQDEEGYEEDVHLEEEEEEEEENQSCDDGVDDEKMKENE